MSAGECSRVYLFDFAFSWLWSFAAHQRRSPCLRKRLIVSALCLRWSSFAELRHDDIIVWVSLCLRDDTIVAFCCSPSPTFLDFVHLSRPRILKFGNNCHFSWKSRSQQEIFCSDIRHSGYCFSRVDKSKIDPAGVKVESPRLGCTVCVLSIMTWWKRADTNRGCPCGCEVKHSTRCFNSGIINL